MKHTDLLAVFVGGSPDAVRQFRSFLDGVIGRSIARCAKQIVAVIGEPSPDLGDVINEANWNDGTSFFLRPWAKKYLAIRYREIFQDTGAKYAAFIGWPHPVTGLDEKTAWKPGIAFNLSTELADFCRSDRKGDDPYAFAIEAHQRMGLSKVTMMCRFVVPNPRKGEVFGEGPVFFSRDIPLIDGLDADRLREIVSLIQADWQPRLAHGIINGHIGWDGNKKHPAYGAEILPPFVHAI